MWFASSVVLLGFGCGTAHHAEEPQWALSEEQVRVVFPAHERADSAKVLILIDALHSQVPLRGLPADVLAGKKVTISLASQWPSGLYGRSSPIHYLIILPFAEAFSWEPDKLRRVIRHELAHIGLGTFLGYAQVPRWFDEGFAEWSVGGLTCEGEIRVRLEISMRRREQDPPPSLFVPGGLGRSRLRYDLFATFFEYIDEKWGRVVESGKLLDAVKANGVHLGLVRALGENVEALEDGWRSYLLDRYDGLPEHATQPNGITQESRYSRMNRQEKSRHRMRNEVRFDSSIRSATLPCAVPSRH